MNHPRQPAPGKLARPDQPEQVSTAVAVPNQQKSLKEVRSNFIAHLQDGISQAAGKLLDKSQFSQALATVLTENPALLKANMASLAVAVLHAARLGLDLTPSLQLAFLAPFNVSKKTDNGWIKVPMVKLMIGYKGFVLMARRAGLCDKVDARAVYTRDDFEWEEGLFPKLIHRPTMGSDRGDVRAAYARAKMKGGDMEFRVVDLPEIEKARRASKGAFEYDSKTRGPDLNRPKKDSPWTTHFAEMAEKTAIRRFFKGFDLTDFRLIATAIAVDDAYDMGQRVPIPQAVSGDPVKPPEQLVETSDWPDFGGDDEYYEGETETVVETSAEDAATE